MIKLYACLGSGNCFKPWLAMQQLDVSFQLTLIDVLSGEQKQPSYLAINPLGVVPFMRTHNETGIGESNAMLWYLSEGTFLMPDHPAERAQALQWMFFEQSKLEPFISPARFFTTIVPSQAAAHADDIATWQGKADSGLKELDAHLEGRDFMLPSGYSVADIATYGYVHVLEEAGLVMSDYPHVERWARTVSETPGYRPIGELGHRDSRAA